MLDKSTRDAMRWNRAFENEGPGSDRLIKEWFELPGAPNFVDDTDADIALRMTAREYFEQLPGDTDDSNDEPAQWALDALDARDDAWREKTRNEAVEALRTFIKNDYSTEHFYRALWAISALWGKTGYSFDTKKTLNLESLSRNTFARVYKFVCAVARRIYIRASADKWSARAEQSKTEIEQAAQHYLNITSIKNKKWVNAQLGFNNKDERKSFGGFKKAREKEAKKDNNSDSERLARDLYYSDFFTRHLCFSQSKHVNKAVFETFKKDEYTDPALSAWATFEFGRTFAALEHLPGSWISDEKIRENLVEAWNSGNGDGAREKFAVILNALDSLRFGSDRDANLGKTFAARKNDTAQAERLAERCKQIVKQCADTADTANSKEILARTADVLSKFYTRTTNNALKNAPAHETILRLCDVDFWKKKIRKTRLQQRENVARAMGVFGFDDKKKWVSDVGTEEVQEADRQMKKTLSEMYVTAGEKIFSVAEIIENSPSNEKNRAAETFKRIEGIGKYAQEQGRVCVFTVLTLESEWHRTSRGRENKNWNGRTVAEGHQELNRRYKIASARFSDAGINAIGFRTTEAHTDATVHWNICAYVLPEHAAEYKRILVNEFYEKYDAASENESIEYQNKMRDIRVRFKTIEIGEDADLGQATARYISKYIFKHLESDDGNDGVRGRHQVWNSIHSIRKFQFFGTKAIGIYRELRRFGISVAACERLIKNRTFDNWPEQFQLAYLAAAGLAIEKDASGKRRVLKLEHVDFCDYLNKTEPLNIKLVDDACERAFTQEEIEKKAELARKLNIEPSELGLGKYGNRKAKKKNHFLLVLNELEHVIPCAKREDWQQCDHNGRTFEAQTFSDFEIDIDFLAVKMPSMRKPEFSLDALARVVTNSPALLFSNAKNTEKNSTVELFKNNPSRMPGNFSAAEVAFLRLKAKIFDDLPPSDEDLVEKMNADFYKKDSEKEWVTGISG